MKKIVMFSEGNIYKLTNLPILTELSKYISVHYITIDPNDDVLQNPPTNVFVFLIKLDFWGLLFLQTLKAELFITTTPGLGSLVLKRSQYVKHYSNYLHLPIDLHHYQKYSFDCFDSVVCSSEYQVQSLNDLEDKRKLSSKEKPVLGLAYYDNFVNEFIKNLSDSDSCKTVLLAPSWGNKNLLNYYKGDLIGELINSGYKVIFRPHPQSFKSENGHIQSIMQKYQNNSFFTLDTDLSFTRSFQQSSILISSYSGIVFDYAFLREKACIVFDIPYVFSNSDSEDILHECWEYQNISQLGTVVSLSSLKSIIEYITQIEKDQNDIVQSIHTIKAEVKNFGYSSKYIAEYYIEK